MMVLVVYDVSDTAKRTRLAKTLEKMGLRRIQRSAFIGSMSYARALDVARASEAVIDKETDVVHVVPLCHSDWRKTIVVGTPKWASGAPAHSVIAR